MIRKAYKQILLNLANISLRKYNTKLVVIYGWDWSEGVREGTYNILHGNTKVRRNTHWIDWDMGLPLFILGYPYARKTSRLGISFYIIRACFNLLKPIDYKNNYLVVSLSAKTDETLNYWLQIEKFACLVLLPTKPEQSSHLETLRRFKQAPVFDYTKLAYGKDRKQSKFNSAYSRLNPFQRRLAIILEQFNKDYWRQREFDLRSDDVIDAVLKIDWGDYFLDRIKLNLQREQNAN